MYSVKCIFVGPSNSGKTSLMRQFTDDEFPLHTDTTIGVEFGRRTLTVDDKIVKVNIFDSAGDERFICLVTRYYSQSALAFVIIDITDYSSVSSIGKWVKRVRSENDDDIKIVIVGNKIDLDHRRVISNKQGRDIAKKYNCVYREISAKTNLNVESLFEETIGFVLRENRLRCFKHEPIHEDDEMYISSTEVMTCCLVM